MLVKKLLLSVLFSAAVLAGGSLLCPGATPDTSATPVGERLVSRTMPPSDPKPGGPKKPRRVLLLNLA